MLHRLLVSKSFVLPLPTLFSAIWGNLQIKSLTMRSLAVVLFVGSGLCRDIVFPPVLGIDRYNNGQARIQLNNDEGDVPLITDAMGGLTSFAHLPYSACFSPKADAEIESYDIAVIGAPFDTVRIKNLIPSMFQCEPTY